MASWLPVPIPSPMNPTHILRPDIKIHFNIILPCRPMFSKWLFRPFKFPDRNSVRIFHLCRASRTQITILIIIQPSYSSSSDCSSPLLPNEPWGAFEGQCLTRWGVQLQSSYLILSLKFHNHAIIRFINSSRKLKVWVRIWRDVMIDLL